MGQRQVDGGSWPAWASWTKGPLSMQYCSMTKNRDPWAHSGTSKFMWKCQCCSQLRRKLTLFKQLLTCCHKINVSMFLFCFVLRQWNFFSKAPLRSNTFCSEKLGWFNRFCNHISSPPIWSVATVAIYSNRSSHVQQKEAQWAVDFFMAALAKKKKLTYINDGIFSSKWPLFGIHNLIWCQCGVDRKCNKINWPFVTTKR